MLDESELAVREQLNEVKSLLRPISTYSSDFQEAEKRIESITIELNDLANELQRLQNQSEYDPQKAEVLKQKLDYINKLEKKHDANGLEELIQIRDRLDQMLQTSSNLEEEIAELSTALEQAENEMRSAGEKLSESRRLSALNLSDEIEKLIQKIGIENGTIEIRITQVHPSTYGLDKVEMLFSANKGTAARELKEVASGGEFSRLIFAIKYLIAGKTALPTLIFDEIDTGISGQVAMQTIAMMKEMAKNHQVISISHLPQFAAKGDAHYFVYKDHLSERSVSKIKKLTLQERVQEIATMIAGKDPSDSAIENAKELLQIV